MFKYFLLAYIVSTCKGTNSSFPSWIDLECQEGHKYIFSDTVLTWNDAISECGLYGGWLVAINSLAENNCLVKHGASLGGVDWWYWTDGNDVETNGVYVHYNYGDMEWIIPKWWCSVNYQYGAGEAFQLLIWSSSNFARFTGSWCDEDITTESFFICESLMTPA